MTITEWILIIGWVGCMFIAVLEAKRIQRRHRRQKEQMWTAHEGHIARVRSEHNTDTKRLGRTIKAQDGSLELKSEHIVVLTEANEKLELLIDEHERGIKSRQELIDLQNIQITVLEGKLAEAERHNKVHIAENERLRSENHSLVYGRKTNV